MLVDSDKIEWSFVIKVFFGLFNFKGEKIVKMCHVNLRGGYGILLCNVAGQLVSSKEAHYLRLHFYI